MHEDNVTMVLKTMLTGTEKKLARAIGINALFMAETGRAYLQGYIRAISESIDAINLVIDTYIEMVNKDTADNNMTAPTGSC